MDVGKRGLIYERAIREKTLEIGWNQPLVLNNLFLPEPTWMSTPHILEMAFEIDRIPALRPLGIATRVCSILARWSLAPELPICVPNVCFAQTAITESFTSNRTALAKISFLSVILSFDKWIKERWLSIDSVHWGKLNKPETYRISVLFTGY